MRCRSARVLIGSLGLALALFASPPAVPGEPRWPAATAGTAYRLVEGSYLVDDCTICGRPTFRVPIHGSFQLIPNGQDPLFANYAVGAFRFAGDPMPRSYAGSGRGSYRQGGEVAIVEEMTLTLRIGNRTGIRMSSGLVSPQARLPWIEIDLVEEPLAGRIQFYRLHLVAVAWPEVWFSTDLPFGSMRREIGRVSDGDLLSSNGSVARRGGALAARLGIMPPPPDLGLDAVLVPDPNAEPAKRLARPEIWFSLDKDAWSESLGELHHGDLLSDAGRVVRRFDELVSPFCPQPPVSDFGLDAVAHAPGGGLLFSVEQGFFSECLGVGISRSDLLAEGGSVFRRGTDLLAKFHVEPGELEDVGLDAAHVFPDGEVWFSTDTAFRDERYGAVGEGDLLSDTGRIVARNRELLGPFRPVEDLADFGLDALHVVSPPVIRGLCGTIVRGVECPLFAADNGKTFILSTTGGFKPGDRVQVTGELRRACASFCMQGDGCIEVESIVACPGPSGASSLQR